MPVKPIPAGYHSVTPYLAIRQATDAIEFYKRALGAMEIYRMPTPDGSSLLHAELHIGGAPIYLVDEFLEVPSAARAPKTLGATTASIHLNIDDDIDDAFNRAAAAGMTVLIPLADMFWGDRFGKLQDPFGHQWTMSKQIRKLTPEQVAEAAKAAFAPKS